MKNDIILKLTVHLLDNEDKMEDINSSNGFFKCGECYLIRTATMIDVGKVKAIDDLGLTLTNASWIADTGRFNNALKTGELGEVEPFVNDCFVSFGAIIDATIWSNKLPDSVK